MPVQSRKGIGGAPSKLTPERMERLLHAIRKGNYIEIACKIVGINQATYHKWMVRGEREGKGQYFEFLEAVEAAQAECEAALVERWHDQTPLDWKAANVLMARRFRDRWGVTESQPNDVVVNITHADADKHTVTQSTRRTDRDKRKPRKA